MTDADRHLLRQIRSRLTIIAASVSAIAVVLVVPLLIAFASSILKPVILLLISVLAIAAIALFFFARGTFGRVPMRRRGFEPQYRQR